MAVEAGAPVGETFRELFETERGPLRHQIRARAVTDCICDSLPNEAMRRCFTESEVMRSNRAPQ